MPLSNVFRRSITSPFQNQSQRKNTNTHGHTHFRSGNTDTITSYTTNTNTNTNTNNKEKQKQPMKDNNSKRKSKSKKNSELETSIYSLSSSSLPSPTSHSTSITATTTIPSSLTMLEMVSHLEISKSHPAQILEKSSLGENENGKQQQQQYQQEILEDISRESSCSPTPPSPGISMPSTPISPSTSEPPFFTLHPNNRSITSSPEPFTPETTKSTADTTTTTTSNNMAMTGRTGTIGSKFGSMFSKSSQQQQQQQRRRQRQDTKDLSNITVPTSSQQLESECGSTILDVEGQTPQEGMKKRLSSGTLHIPIGTFLSNTFRSRRLSLQHDSVSAQNVQQQQERQEQQPKSLRKKRKGLLPKLPKLDTRPKFIVSSPSLPAVSTKKEGEGVGVGTKSMKNKGSLFRNNKKKEIDTTSTITNSISTPGFSSISLPHPASPPTPQRSSSASKSSLLSPFYLPATLRNFSKNRNLNPNIRLPPPHSQDSSSTSVPVTGTNNGHVKAKNNSQVTQLSSKELELSSTGTSTPDDEVITVVTVVTAAVTADTTADTAADAAAAAKSWDWERNSQLYHDTRWDDDGVSVATVDSEAIRISSDPNFPGYPERNAYWQKHCRIRERRHRKHQQLHEQQRPADLLFGHSVLDSDRDDSEGGQQKRQREQEEEEEFDPVKSLRDARNRLRDPAERTITTPNDKRFRPKRERYTTYTAYMAAMQQKAKDHEKSLDDDNDDDGEDDDYCVVADSESQLDSREIYHSQGHGKGSQWKRQSDRGILFVNSSIATTEICSNLMHDPESLPQIQRNQPFSPKTIYKNNSFTNESNKTSTSTIKRLRDESGGGSGDGESPDALNDPSSGSLEASDRPSSANVEANADAEANADVKADTDNEADADANANAEVNANAEANANTKANAEANASADSTSADSTSPSNINVINDIDSTSSSKSKNSGGASTPDLGIRKEEDLCLSQPGSYASHNHIMPLERLLELQDQEQWKVRQLQNRLRLSLQRADKKHNHRHHHQECQGQSPPLKPSPLDQQLSSPSLVSLLTHKRSSLSGISPSLPSNPSHLSQTSFSSSTTTVTTTTATTISSTSSSSTLLHPNRSTTLPYPNRSTTSSSSRLLRAWSSNSSIFLATSRTPATTATSPTTILHKSPESPTSSSPPTSWSPELPRPLKPALSTTFANLLDEANIDDTASIASSTQSQDHRHKYVHRRQNSYSSMSSMSSVSSRQEPSNHGHMLLMLHDGRMHYYKDGARKTGPEWDDGFSDNIHDTNDGDDDVERNLADGLDNNTCTDGGVEEYKIDDHNDGSQDDNTHEEDSQNRPPFSPVEYRSPHSPHSPRLFMKHHSSASGLISRPLPPPLLMDPKGRRHSTYLKTTNISESLAGENTNHHQHRRQSSFSSLGCMHGTKSRASISYSTVPTIAMPTSPLSTSSPSFPSDSTTALLSAIKMENKPK
ncbi:hypothetical protein BGZ49_008099 [Haplosporangium sp. Z 27]|nr:hypothetical protein BGZ49_008099 [Haplosporangium sp. Z 27]